MENKKRMFILDTNMIPLLLPEVYPNKDVWKIKTMSKFFERFNNEVFILDIVWTEFLGIFLQKGIDFNDYHKWYRDRVEYLTKVIAKFTKKSFQYIFISDKSEYSDLFNQSIDLATYPIDLKLIEKLKNASEQRIKMHKNNYEKSNDFSEKSQSEAHIKRLEKDSKLFDGIDSAIVIYAKIISEIHQDTEVYVVSDDWGVINGIKFFKEIKDQNYKNVYPVSIGELNNFYYYNKLYK